MPDRFLTAVAAVTNTLFLLGGVYVYLSLIRQIAGRAETEGETSVRAFGFPDAIVAVGLATLFIWSTLAAVPSPGGKLVLRTNDLIANALVSLSLLFFVAAFLKIRAFDVTALAGFGKLSFRRSLVTGVVLLFAAYPLVFVAGILTERVFREPPSRQGILEVFDASQTLQQRVMIIILAVVFAPIVEEFVFRFFFYGVMKRYVGRFAGLIVNSLIFAAVHAHVPSAGPLFVLAACLTLAYEWSGSILVSMTMHALFNSMTLTALAFPNVAGQ
jgi:membrane protease YdiL (CAAX protease family)